MKRSIQVAILAFFLSIDIAAAPLIQKIINHSDVGFVILEHSDTSGCSLKNRGTVIDAHGTFDYDFLLELGRPSVVLRPIYYISPVTGKKSMLVDECNQYQPERVQEAHEAFKHSKKAKKFKTAQDWLQDFIGLDISVIPHEVEILGYLLNLSRVMIKNHRYQQAHWMSFAKGIFSKLVLELNIYQNRYKGIYATISVLHGEGGVCTDGAVERL